MTATPDGRPDGARSRAHVPSPSGEDHRSHGMRHGLLMLACCVPMLLVVAVLVATGVAGSGPIVFALLCIAMMAAMMFGMPGHRH